MSIPTFRGRGDIPGYKPKERDALPFRDPRQYEASEELARAVNVALALEKPLLVTGEPGTGKTELAYRIGAELGLEVLRFDTQSSSQAHDLFYHFDAVHRLAEAQFAALEKRAIPPAFQSLSFRALGEAIVRTLGPDERPAWMTTHVHARPARSVVLIDEIDKAPRDFPNDLLNHVENLEFMAREAGMSEPLRARRQRDGLRLTPIVVMTSNSERQLPEPFLRRCIYHHIEFPDANALVRILQGRLRGEGGGGATPKDDELRGFVDWILELRRDPAIEKRASTAEMLDAVRALQLGPLPVGSRASFGDRSAYRGVLGTLFKTRADIERARSQLLAATKA